MSIENNATSDFINDMDKAVVAGENSAAERNEVTIKFGKGLVGEPFVSKNGKELVEVSIPNSRDDDHRPWESFVISPKMIHENKFGKGVWMKLPEDGSVRLSRPVKNGTDDKGKTIWSHETREVSNVELKAILEAYKEKGKDSVLSDLSGKRAEAGSDRTAGFLVKNRTDLLR